MTNQDALTRLEEWLADQSYHREIVITRWGDEFTVTLHKSYSDGSNGYNGEGSTLSAAIEAVLKEVEGE